MEQPKFKILDEVYCEGALYWVIGINMKCGYDMTLWEYNIGKMMYDEAPPTHHGDKMSKGWHRDDQLRTPLEEVHYRHKELMDTIEKKKQELEELEKRASTCTSPASEAS